MEDLLLPNVRSSKAMKASLEKVSLFTPITVTGLSQVTVTELGEILVPRALIAADTANFYNIATKVTLLLL